MFVIFPSGIIKSIDVFDDDLPGAVIALGAVQNTPKLVYPDWVDFCTKNSEEIEKILTDKSGSLLISDLSSMGV